MFPQELKCLSHAQSAARKTTTPITNQMRLCFNETQNFGVDFFCEGERAIGIG